MSGVLNESVKGLNLTPSHQSSARRQQRGAAASSGLPRWGQESAPPFGGQVRFVSSGAIQVMKSEDGFQHSPLAASCFLTVEVWEKEIKLEVKWEKKVTLHTNEE